MARMLVRTRERRAPSEYFGLAGIAALLLDDAIERVAPHLADIKDDARPPGITLRG